MRSRLLDDGSLETLAADYDEAEWPNLTALRLQRLAVERKLAMLDGC